MFIYYNIKHANQKKRFWKKKKKIPADPVLICIDIYKEKKWKLDLVTQK